MEIILPIILFIIGLAVIIKGGDLFVDSAIWVAKVTGIPNIIIGATIVSLATTLPELFVSTIATVSGSPDIAIGNAIGSIICNTGLILAISMIFMPGEVEKESFLPKAFTMVVSTILLLLFATSGSINWIEGILLILVLIYYIRQNLMEAKKSMILSNEAAATIAEEECSIVEKPTSRVVVKNIVMFISGAALIVIGARLLVNNAQIIAKFFKVPESIVSLTIVALGTSLPEFVTALTSVAKKEGGVAVGNIIGANILNIDMIVAVCGIISKGGLVITSRNLIIGGFRFINFHQTLLMDIPVALLMMLLIIMPVILKGKYSKKNGIALLSVYILYIAFLFISL